MGGGVKEIIYLRIGWGGGRFRLIVGSHLQTLIVLGWMGDAEMWELRIMCSNWGWMCQTQNMFKNWSGGGGVNRFKLIVGSHLHFTKLIDLGSVGSAEMWELRIRCSNWGWMCKRKKMFKN